tara:strand:- start:608 stop:949 length:342 start_codon:yes stop_codon:yes gene_type:complete
MKKKNLKKIFKDFWHGKMSLKFSFWIAYFLVGGAFTIPSFFITDAYIDRIGDGMAFLLLVYIVILYIYLIITFIGTWRSASNFKPKKNQWSWGTIAKVYMVINILQSITKLVV